MADLGRRHVARLPKLERIKQHIALLKILVHPGVRLHDPRGSAPRWPPCAARRKRPVSSLS